MVKPPSRERLRDLSADFFTPPTAAELDEFESLAETWLSDHERVATLAADRTPAPDRGPADVDLCRHKPTFGLVPYTSGASLEPTVDHVGPMAQSVADCALVLDAMAGPHPTNSRQGSFPPTRTTDALDANRPLTIGVLETGFDFDASDPAVSDRVRTTTDALEADGHTVESVSAPLHADGVAIYNAIVVEAHAALVQHEGVGYHR